MVNPMRLRTLAVTAALLWVAVTLVLLTAQWSLSCTIDGQGANGIDCFQENAMPHAGSAPARWFGFVPLALAWATVTGLMVWSAIAMRRRSSR